MGATLLITRRDTFPPPPPTAEAAGTGRPPGAKPRPCPPPAVRGLQAPGGSPTNGSSPQASSQGQGSSQRSPSPPVVSPGPPRVTWPGPSVPPEPGGLSSRALPVGPSAAEMRHPDPDGPGGEKSSCPSPETCPGAHTASTQGPTIQRAVTPKPAAGTCSSPSQEHLGGSSRLPPASI